MDEKQIEQLMIALGAMSEMTALFFKNLVNQGVPEEYAAVLTSALIRQLFPSPQMPTN